MTTCVKKIETREDLNAVAEAARLRGVASDSAKFGTRIMLCMGSGCIASGAVKVRDAIIAELKRLGRDDVPVVEIVETGCNGFCAGGPVMTLYPGGFFYNKVTPEDAVELIGKHIMKAEPIERIMYHSPDGAIIPKLDDIPFFSHQQPIVLRNRGRISAEDISDYIGCDGYLGVYKALLEMTPDEIIFAVKSSGLRGRGGGGFSTGMKWEFAARAEADQKYVLCNADEGDPGAFMDRSVLEGDPHAVIEGMIIAGKAIGASEGKVYCRAEYPLALERLSKAIEDARQAGLLGENIFGTGFGFDIEICQGAGAFVCGEETALIASIEGNRGEPRIRPPFPAQSGLWKKPTLLNNVETFANIAQIILQGPEQFAAIGTEKSKGTKVFALTGTVNNIGLVEVPMGTTLGQIVFDIGGGIPNGKKFKAAQVGGPSGGCIPEEHLDVPLDFDSLNELGAIMGSGGLVVMDENTCMVDVARFFLEFVQEESCGKCVPCRLGTKQMLDIIKRICNGQGEEGDCELLEQCAINIKASALCGLGQTAPNPVLSTLRYFRHEYDEHIREKKCSAGVCHALLAYHIDPEKCVGCTACVKKCPVDAIIGQAKQPHQIIHEKCIHCGACMMACRFNAIVKE